MEEFSFKSTNDIHSDSLGDTTYKAIFDGNNYIVSWQDKYTGWKSLNYPKSAVEKYMDSGYWVIVND